MGLAQLRIVCFAFFLHQANGFHLNIIEVILGRNPLYGLAASAPAFDVAFERLKYIYPELTSNTSRYRIHNPQTLPCSDAAGLMLTVGAEVMDLVQRLTGFTVLISPGLYDI